MSRQIFGYTEAIQSPGGYVQFIAVTTTDNGGTLVSVRNMRGEYNAINLPPDEARALAKAIADSLP